MINTSRQKITVADLSFISGLTILPSIMLIAFQIYAALLMVALAIGFYFIDSKFKLLKVEIKWFSLSYWFALIISSLISVVVFELNNGISKFVPLFGLFYLIVLYVLCKPVMMED